jgi:hypothetical protein
LDVRSKTILHRHFSKAPPVRGLNFEPRVTAKFASAIQKTAGGTDAKPVGGNSVNSKSDLAPVVRAEGSGTHRA